MARKKGLTSQQVAKITATMPEERFSRLKAGQVVMFKHYNDWRMCLVTSVAHRSISVRVNCVKLDTQRPLSQAFTKGHDTPVYIVGNVTSKARRIAENIIKRTGAK